MNIRNTRNVNIQLLLVRHEANRSLKTQNKHKFCCQFQSCHLTLERPLLPAPCAHLRPPKVDRWRLPCQRLWGWPWSSSWSTRCAGRPSLACRCGPPGTLTPPREVCEHTTPTPVSTVCRFLKLTGFSLWNKPIQKTKQNKKIICCCTNI